MFVFKSGGRSVTGNYLLILLAFQLQHAQCANPNEANSRWWGFTRFTTSSGEPCVTPCRKSDGSDYFTCYIAQRMDPDEPILTYGKCSPEVGVDITGHKCVSACQRNWYYGYCCYTDDKGNWNYCGNTLPGPEPPTPNTRLVTTRGELCLSPCERAGYTYTWCLNSLDWDYCSDQPDHDYYGKECKDSCDFHGYSYTWCTLEDGSWNYCGTIFQNPKVEFTSSGSKCISECEYSAGWKSNVCDDASLRRNIYVEDLIRCSKEPGKSANNLDCKGPCAPDGGSGGKREDYDWCWTNTEKTEWFQCSKVWNNSGNTALQKPIYELAKIEFQNEMQTLDGKEEDKESNDIDEYRIETDSVSDILGILTNNI